VPTQIKLEIYDQIILKNLTGAIIALVFIGFGLWASGVNGSILDSADIVVAEAELNEPGEAQDLNEHFAQTKAVGIEGSLRNPNDEDAYRFSIGPDWSMDLLFGIKATEDKTITAVAAGKDLHVYFVSGNSIWRRSLARQDVQAELIISSLTLAQFLDLEDVTQLQVNALAGMPDPDAEINIVVALGGDQSPVGGNVLALDSDNELKMIIPRDNIIALTGESAVDLTTVAADEEGRIYVGDQVSGSILRIEQGSVPLPSTYMVSIYTDAEVLQEAVVPIILENLSQGLTSARRTILAEATGDFVVNSLVKGSGNYAVSGYDSYYLGQLDTAFGGSGGITRITINQLDAQDVTFEEFYTPDRDALELLNPSALALDTTSTFGRLMYMGTFGPSLGDDFDGEIYIVYDNGDIDLYVKSFEDGGGAAMKGGELVTGFFDVVDMAFPPTMNGSFGPYLYVLSENIDQNGTTEGGFSSDLWRVDQEGVAHLFVEGIADGVISLAFGNADYGDDLFVATFDSGISEGMVWRVDSEGNVEPFHDFSSFGASVSVSDMQFAPTDVPGNSPLAGSLVLTLKTVDSSFVVQLEPDGVTYQIWAADLETGDVSSGDLIFDEFGNLIIAQQGAKNLVRMDYQDLFTISFDQLQVRPMLEDGLEPISWVPYLLTNVGNQPRILHLSNSGNAADIITEVSPSVLDIGEVPADGSKQVSFTFDAVGDLFTYIQNVDELRTSQRNQEGKFTQFTTLLTGLEIDAFTDLVDAHLPQLAWAGDGSLVAIGTNGSEAPFGGDPPSQDFDDVVMWVGNTIDGEYEPNALEQVSGLVQMRLELTGPGESHEFIAGAGSVLEETLEGLTEGSYSLTVGSTLASSGPYEIVIILNNTRTIFCDESSGPQELTGPNGDRLILTHNGPGRTELEYLEDPNGVATELTRLTITGSNSSTAVTLVNRQNLDDVILGELVLNGSLDRLEYKGTLDMLRGNDSTKGTVKHVDLGTVRDVNAAKYTFPDFRATNLGDPETEDHKFLAKKLTKLIVENNVEYINILEFESRNAYRLIDIGGIVDTGKFFGLSISDCIIRNEQNEERAMNESYLSCTLSGGYINKVRIEQGDLYKTGIFADKSIKQVELLNGNLDTSTVETLGKKSSVDTVIVRRVEALTDPNESGNILGSRIAANRRVNRVHATEDIDDGTVIRTTGYLRSLIDTVTCQGDCSASFRSLRIKEILVGFDENKQKMPEANEFTGGNFNGSVYVTLSLDLLSATGSIENAYIGATAAYGYGSIKSVFAEDGFISSTVSCYKKATRIMVGYENGNRNRIVNNNADVSGTISGPRLGRLYYTGENTANLSVGRVGPVIDDVP